MLKFDPHDEMQPGGIFHKRIRAVLEKGANHSCDQQSRGLTGYPESEFSIKASFTKLLMVAVPCHMLYLGILSA